MLNQTRMKGSFSYLIHTHSLRSRPTQPACCWVAMINVVKVQPQRVVKTRDARTRTINPGKLCGQSTSCALCMEEKKQCVHYTRTGKAEEDQSKYKPSTNQAYKSYIPLTWPQLPDASVLHHSFFWVAGRHTPTGLCHLPLAYMKRLVCFLQGSCRQGTFFLFALRIQATASTQWPPPVCVHQQRDVLCVCVASAAAATIIS